MIRPRSRVFWAVIALLVASASAGPEVSWGAPASAADRRAVGLESGRGLIGEWTLIWRYDPFGEGETVYRAVMGHDFPRRAAASSGRPEIAFFDREGRLEESVPLAPGETALPAADGRSYLVWSAVSTSRRLLNYRYHVRGRDEPDWEASAVGEPLLFAPDGSLFVIAAADTAYDDFRRALPRLSGNVQVVDATGGVLGEMPIRPAYVRLTGDGARIAMLHAEELVVLRADGRLDWNVRLPVDAVVLREGISQLEAAGGVVVVTGTGESDHSTTFRRERHGTIHAFTDSGELLWSVMQSDREPLWFQLSGALSSDGGTLATFHTAMREIIVQAWDARGGDLLWRHALPRGAGGRCLSVAPNGELVVLASGDLRTAVVAWDREGSVVWEGTVPFLATTPRIEADGLLVSERWMVRLFPEWAE